MATPPPTWPPSGIDVLDRRDRTPAETQHAKDHNDEQAAINAILAKLGTEDPAGTYPSVAVRLDALEARRIGPLVFTLVGPATSFSIQHNLGYVPDIRLVDSAGHEYWTEIDSSDLYASLIVFDSPASGFTAYVS